MKFVLIYEEKQEIDKLKVPELGMTHVIGLWNSLWYSYTRKSLIL
jgi:hypothetical protein